MNNKGMSMEVIIALVIAAGILVLLFFGPIKGILADKALPFFDNLPGFEQEDKQSIFLGNVRYNVLEDSVEIYDGERWNLFEKDREFSSLEEPVSEAELKEAFNGYYFDEKNRNYRERLLVFEDKVVIASRVLDGPELLNVGSMADRNWVMLEIWRTRSDGGLEAITNTFVFVNPTGDPKEVITTGEAKKILTVEQLALIAEKAIPWRNSVVKKPIMIKGKSYCVSLVDNIYLNINMNRDGACNG